MSWCVGACRTRLELPLAIRLGEAGYDAYSPRIPGEKGDRGAYPGYLFVNMHTIVPAIAEAARWGTRFRVLLAGGEFAQVSDELVSSLKAAERAGEFTETYEIRNGKFTIGQRVRITNSAFAGLDGIVTRCKRHWTWLSHADFPSADIRFPNSILQAIEKGV